MGSSGCHVYVPLHCPLTQSGPLHFPLVTTGKTTGDGVSVEEVVGIGLLIGITIGVTVTDSVVMIPLVVAASLEMDEALCVPSTDVVVTDAGLRNRVVVGPAVTPVLLLSVAELCSAPDGSVVVRSLTTDEVTSENAVLVALSEAAVAVLITTVLVSATNVVLTPG